MPYGSVASPRSGPDAGGRATDTSDDIRDQDGAPTAATAESPEPKGRLSTAKQKLKAFYDKNFGLFLVFVAQMFGSVMTTSTRLLETGFDVKFHALEVIFVRMFVTTAIGTVYMWYKQIPGFPLGPREVRGLLVIRGIAGSTGLFGLYYSLSYLPISDATVITFLVPTMTAFVCWVALKEPFTTKEACAGLMAFAGMLFVARPAFLFMPRDANAPSPQFSQESLLPASVGVVQGGILPPPEVTPVEHSIAIGCAIMGAFSAATAYATIRVIGQRAHSLVSVNYFSVLSTVSSFLIIMIHPDLHFKIPQSPIQWILLATIGVSGFLLQILLTEGLRMEKGGRATNMIYVQLVFALIIERVIWGTTPPLYSLIGSAMIIGSAIWVSLQKKTALQQKAASDEEQSLLNSDGEARRG